MGIFSGGATQEIRLPCMKCRKMIFRKSGLDLSAVYCVDCQETYGLTDSATPPPAQTESDAISAEAVPGNPSFLAPHTSIRVTQALREDGRKNMLVGGLWCVGGIVVTVATYQAAANSPGGGTYFVAWGAIVFGAIQFFRGLSQITGR